MLTKKVADVAKDLRARTKIITCTVLKILGEFHVYINIC